MKVEKIIKQSRAKLLAEIKEFRKNISATGVAFGSIVYFVDESGAKVKGGKKVLQKLVRVSITLGAKYDNRINKDLVKNGEEGNFTAQSMSGKEYVNEERILATDTKTGTKFYLVAVVENHAKPDTIYFHEGKRITKDKAIELGLFMPSYFAPKTTMGRGNMSEAKDFHIINPNVDNIISLKLNKVKRIIEN
ncbi:MAG TPA: hypothetical protein VMW66_05970 [Elusimicrobiales bacterium]|nr:hypothetical protein [Elusimicrobiales bacterium]